MYQLADWTKARVYISALDSNLLRTASSGLIFIFTLANRLAYMLTAPLHVAAGWLHSEAVVQVLIGANPPDVAASLRAKPTSGGLMERTPVFWAGYYGHVATQDRLIRFMLGAGWHYRPETDAFWQESPHEQARQEEAGTALGTASRKPREAGESGEVAAAAAAAAGLQDLDAAGSLRSDPPPMSAAEAIAALGISSDTALITELTNLMRLAGANPTEAEAAMYRKQVMQTSTHTALLTLLPAADVHVLDRVLRPVRCCSCAWPASNQSVCRC